MSDKEEGIEVPILVKVLAIALFLFSMLAFWGSLFLWGEGFLLQFPEDVSWTFPLTDVLINAPASMIAAIGLWQMKRYGYAASQFVAGFYLYASVYIFVEVIQAGPPYPVEIVVPQVLAVLVAIGLIFYLWRIQDRFK